MRGVQVYDKCGTNSSMRLIVYKFQKRNKNVTEDRHCHIMLNNIINFSYLLISTSMVHCFVHNGTATRN